MEFDRSKWEPKVGDLVRIRQWDDMLQEFGTTELGNIKCAFNFVSDMRYLCGTEFTITGIGNPSFLRTKMISGLDCSYSISIDMIEPVVFFDRESWEPEPGEVVRVREWDDMVSEYGLIGSKIPVRFGFYKSMNHLCGREYVVESVGDNGEVYGHGSGFAISKDILVPTQISTSPVFDEPEMSDFLGTFTVI